MKLRYIDEGREAIARLEALSAPAGPFSFFAIYLARLACRRAGDEGDYALYLAVLLTAFVINHRRQVCLFLDRLPENPARWLGADLDASSGPAAAAFAELAWPPDWWRRLVAHPAVAGPEEAPCRRHLLVLDGKRLYLQRYWSYEQNLARMIRERAQVEGVPPAGLPPLAVVAPRFGRSRSGDGDNLQAAAVLAGLTNHFTVISGGPGCGKTAIVAAIAALYLEQKPDFAIALCAPTGLAQARLLQALHEEVDHLRCSAATRARLRCLPAATIHRLLAYRPGEGFRYHAGHRLALDLLVVDEASMVPLWIMSSLFSALPATCRVILLGDHNQLASVEAGAVLADICRLWDGEPFSASFRARLKTFIVGTEGPERGSRETPEGTESPPPETAPAAGGGLFRDRVVELRRSYRFAPGGGIARLQRAILGVREDDGRALLEVLAEDSSGEVLLRRLPAVGAGLEEFLLRELPRLQVVTASGERPWKDFIAAATVAEAFSCFKCLRLLTPLRRGPLGSENLNRLAARAFGLAGERWPAGRPLLITRNQPRLNLFNGDVGLLCGSVEEGVRAWFEQAAGLVAFSPARLPAHESAFAVTVHKAQGAGFQKVIVIWPDRDSPLLTREMLYTAVTRAASRVEIWLPEPLTPAALVAACRRRVERSSGLAACLGGTGS